MHLDLARALPFAQLRGAFRVVLMGTPQAEPLQALGFARPGAALQDGPFVWAHREARIHLNLPADADRALVLDLELPPGLDDQRARALLNGSEVGRFDIGRSRRRYRVELPLALQERGLNEVVLLFNRASPSVEAGGRRVAAAIRALVVGRADDAPLVSLLNPGALPPLGLVARGGRLGVLQAGPSDRRYAFAAPRHGELRVRPRVPANASKGKAALGMSIVLEVDGRAPRQIWAGDLGPGDEIGEVRAPLGVPAGTPVSLALHVGGEPSGAGWGVWEAPRILGGGAPPVSVAPSTSPADERRAEPVRDAVRGANVLLVVLDAAAARHFGCYGYPRATTPEIDRIAREGVVFERAYTTGCYTRAAMGSIWTSQFPDDHGAVGDRSRLPTTPYPTLAEVLTAAGVHTAGFVANSVAGPAYGMDRGFGEFHEVYKDVGIQADAFPRVLGPWIRSRPRQPFLAYAHFREPHFPYDPPAPFTTRFGPDGPIPKAVRGDRDWIFRANDGTRPLSPEQADHLVRLYDGSLAFADQQVGAIRRILESTGLWDRTTVVVTADHGEALYEHRFIMHNQQLYEDSVRVPLVVRLPPAAGVANRRVEGIVDSTDVGPTIADLLGVGRPAGFRGRSLLAAIQGAPGKPFAFSRSLGARPLFSVRDSRYTFIFDSRGGREELYDRGADPGETRDLRPEAPVRAACYRQTLWAWMGGLARRVGSEGVTEALAPEQRENLRSLGYLQ